jgi:hypothetical protein
MPVMGAVEVARVLASSSATDSHRDPSINSHRNQKQTRRARILLKPSRRGNSPASGVSHTSEVKEEVPTDRSARN